MRKSSKVLLSCIAIPVCLFVGLIVLVNIAVTPERVRETVVPLAQEQLGRVVTLGMIDISLWSGISVHNLIIAEDDGQSNFFEIDELVLKYRFWPLLALRVEVDEASLRGARVKLIKRHDGSFNFSSLGGKKESSADQSLDTKGSEKSTDKEGTPLNLLIATIALDDCSLLYEDRSSGPEPVRYQIDDLNLLIEDFSLTQPFDYMLTTVVNGEPLALNGRVARGTDSVNLQTNLDFRDQQLALKTIVSKLQGPIKIIDWHLSSPRLDLDRLLLVSADAEKDRQKESSSKHSGSVETGEEAGPLDLPLTMTGAVEVNELLARGVSIQDLNVKVLLKDNVFTLDSLRFKLAQGQVDVAARIDLARKGFSYQPRISVTNVQADPLAQIFTPELAGIVNGALTLSFDLQGSGTQIETIKQTLSGTGKFSLSDGHLAGGRLIDGLADFVGEKRLKRIDCNDFSGTFQLDKGKVRLKSGYRGDDLEMSPRGTVGLDESLDLRLEARLSPKLMAKVGEKSKAGRILVDKNGWGLLPVRVRGTVTDPEFEFDSKAVKKQLKRKATEKLTEKLEGKLFGGDSGKSGDESSSRRIKNTLKGLFGN